MSTVPPVEPPPPVDPYAQVVPPPPPVAPPYAPAGYSPAYAPGAYAPVYYGPQEPRGLAIASLVTGIAGVFFSFAYGLGFLPSLAAVITGHLARKRQPQARGMWLAGMITGYIGLGISVLWIIGIIALLFYAASTSGSDFGDYSQTSGY